MNCIIPNIEKLFALSNIAVRVIFKAVNLFKENQKGIYIILNNRINNFKVKYGFDNDYLEISIVYLIDQRLYYIKLDYYNENPHTIWRKY